MMRINAIYRAANVGLVALPPNPEARAYLRVRREACGCTFVQHTQEARLQAAGQRCPECGDTTPSPSVPAPPLWTPPSNTALANQIQDLREALDMLTQSVATIADGLKGVIKANNLKVPD